MSVIIKLPALSPTMTEGKISKWLKKEGDTVKQGSAIAEIETDKATMEVEAPEDGKIAKIIVPEGTEGVKVAGAIAILLEEGEGDAELKDALAKISNTNASPTPPVPTKPADSPVVSAPVQNVAKTNTVANTSGRIFISPLAKRIAENMNINVANIKGSGPNGRIVKADVENAKNNPQLSVANSATSASSYTDVPHSTMRKVIAKRLLESKQTIPHFYVSMDYRVDELLKARVSINEIGKDKFKISVNDMVIKACGLALRDVPEVNAMWNQDYMRMFKQSDIAVAVATKTGLITPIIRGVERKGLMEISAEMKALVKKANDGTLLPEEYQGGGFSISNMGMFGVNQFNPIINPPQASIIGVGASIEKPVVSGGKIEIATIMNITIAADHRVIDGAKAAEFLNALKRYLENPATMIL